MIEFEVNGETKQFLNLVEARKRVGRTRMTIWRWCDSGMPTLLVSGYLYVEESELLKTYRAKLIANKRNRFRLRDKVTSTV